ncbi:exosortase T [Pseudemcibacter aquimaris]|uniref:exosortase T n=1 Tax=Pseudemcibacter aquimaris TaxID=2857064 RepID=UPI0020138480|nr:exosortase T [Pseudemcibacter aquimaris]MCC3859786.1 exosortase T [Pseudemcibacter aquimaris]WDU60180.1 exosortase T [Pseudemcibacter aquimaris]
MRYLYTHHSKLILVFAAALLAYEPVIWLGTSWFDPSYASSGLIIFLVTAALFLWSVTSPVKNTENQTNNIPYILLLGSAVTRLIGQLLAVNMIGALTLVIDVYAIGKILKIDRRVRSLSPFWLSMAFAFSFPLERVIQRVLGYGLQNLSADGACTILQGTIENVTCEGLRILINNKDVLIDLPCSGARAALLLFFFYTLLSAIIKPNFKQALKGFFITILSAYIVNLIRISVLAIFIGFPHLIFGIDVMSQPTHDVIGLLLLFLGVLPIALWARRALSGKKPQKQLPKKLIQDAWWIDNGKKQPKTPYFAGLFAVIAIAIILIPKNAPDVGRRDIPLELPSVIGDEFATHIPLLDKEKAYFTQFGGSARKAIYGDQTLMIVKTSAPLRHLHAPDDCLRGLGMDVEYRGIEYSSIPTAIYKATDKNGIEYRVAVTFISSKHNHMTTNVSEAVFRWLQDPEEDWTAIQRISHWTTPSFDNDAFDQSLIAALELSKKHINIAQLNGAPNE